MKNNTNTKNMNKNNTNKVSQKTYKVKLAKHIFEENLQKYYPEVWKYLHSAEAISARMIISKGKFVKKPAISYRQYRAKNRGTSGILARYNGNKIHRLYVMIPFTPVTNEELFTKMILHDVQLVGEIVKEITNKPSKGLKKIVKDNPFLENCENISTAANAEYNKVIKNIANRKADEFTHMYIYKQDNEIRTFWPANIPSELRFIDFLTKNNIEYETRLVKNFLRAEMMPNKFNENGTYKYRKYDTLDELDKIINKYCIKDETIKERCQKILKKNIERHIKFEAAKKAELEAVAIKKCKGNKFANTEK